MSPAALWRQAYDEFPDDVEARRDRYLALMIEAGNVVKADLGEDRNLPCGWPGVEPAK